MKELPKIYDPKQVESKIYRYWTDGGWFHAERDPDKKPFTIVIPPPNVTGQLHLGHALDETIQDVLIRWKRMSGYCALLLPRDIVIPSKSACEKKRDTFSFDSSPPLKSQGCDTALQLPRPWMRHPALTLADCRPSIYALFRST